MTRASKVSSLQYFVCAFAFFVVLGGYKKGGYKHIFHSPSLYGLVGEVRVHRGRPVAHEAREVVSAPRLSCLHHQRRLKQRRNTHNTNNTRNTHEKMPREDRHNNKM